MKDANCLHKYLFDADYTNVYITSIALECEEANQIQNYDVPYNLFDCDLPFRRKINVDLLDDACDSEKFNFIANLIGNVEELFLIDNRAIVDNAIIQKYSEITLKAYIDLFKKKGIKKIYVVKVISEKIAKSAQICILPGTDVPGLPNACIITNY